jgi:hypothetical protein
MVSIVLDLQAEVNTQVGGGHAGVQKQRFSRRTEGNAVTDGGHHSIWLDTTPKTLGAAALAVRSPNAVKRSRNTHV